ncbi:unnamed protein product, partial [Urochloa humidicola]
GCLCDVSNTYEFAAGNLDIYTIWTLYSTCGGRQQAVPKNRNSCAHAPAAPSPPPPPTPSSPPPPRQPKLSSPPPPETRRPSGLSGRVLAGFVLGIFVGVVACAMVFGGVGFLVHKARAGVRGEGIVTIPARSEAPPPVVGFVEPPPPQLYIPVVHDPPPAAPRISPSSSSRTSSSSSADKADAKVLMNKDLVGKDVVPTIPLVPAVTRLRGDGVF